MTEVLAELAALGVTRSQVRLLTAHYTHQPHVCSAAACGGKDSQGNLIAFTADGTQYTDQFAGAGGAKIDMSLLDDGFFGDPPGWIFARVRYLQVAGVGPHSVKVSWDSPAGPAPEAVHHYQLTVRHLGQDVAEPVSLPKGANPEAYQWNDLHPGTDYELLVRAVAADGHASTWSAVTFRTPAA